MDFVHDGRIPRQPFCPRQIFWVVMDFVHDGRIPQQPFFSKAGFLIDHRFCPCWKNSATIIFSKARSFEWLWILSMMEEFRNNHFSPRQNFLSARGFCLWWKNSATTIFPDVFIPFHFLDISRVIPNLTIFWMIVLLAHSFGYRNIYPFGSLSTRAHFLQKQTCQK